MIEGQIEGAARISVYLLGVVDRALQLEHAVKDLALALAEDLAHSLH